jgi:hypothetical protein
MGPAAVSAPEKPVDFAKQEELDINEIKQNSNLPETNVSVQPHDPQEYDEASNLVRIYSLILLKLNLGQTVNPKIVY